MHLYTGNGGILCIRRFRQTCDTIIVGWTVTEEICEHGVNIICTLLKFSIANTKTAYYFHDFYINFTDLILL